MGVILSVIDFLPAHPAALVHEIEANRFVAKLLMPWDELEKAHEELSGDIGSLANKFNVSKTAMSVRLGLRT